MLDNEMFSFCLLHKEETATALRRARLESPPARSLNKRIKWLHNVIKAKSVGIIAVMGMEEEEEEEEGIVNVA
jgi:hypothetical protein